MNGFTRPDNEFDKTLVLWAHGLVLWLSKHWLTVFNLFFLIYVGLPFLAPILLVSGYTGSANAIYRFYGLSCHQLPSRSFFIWGEQVALCHREVSMYGTLLLGGLVFGLFKDRLKPIPLRWYVFFLVPVALDAGLQLASEWLQFSSMTTLWAIGLLAMGITSAILRSQNYLTWHSYLFFAFGPLALLYLQFFGPYSSNLFLRIITGFIFGFGTIWYAYPLIQQGFRDVQQEIMMKLNRADRRTDEV
jgi:uncharacterized membrane protein